MIGFRYNLPELFNGVYGDMWTFSNISCTLLCTPFYNLTSLMPMYFVIISIWISDSNVQVLATHN